MRSPSSGQASSVTKNGVVKLIAVACARPRNLTDAK
jgi:hypothetical protein